MSCDLLRRFGSGGVLWTGGDLRTVGNRCDRFLTEGNWDSFGLRGGSYDCRRSLRRFVVREVDCEVLEALLVSELEVETDLVSSESEYSSSRMGSEIRSAKGWNLFLNRTLM